MTSGSIFSLLTGHSVQRRADALMVSSAWHRTRQLTPCRHPDTVRRRFQSRRRSASCRWPTILPPPGR